MTNLPRHHCNLSPVMAVMCEEVGHETTNIGFETFYSTIAGERSREQILPQDSQGPQSVARSRPFQHITFPCIRPQPKKCSPFHASGGCRGAQSPKRRRIEKADASNPNNHVATRAGLVDNIEITA